MQYRIEFDAYSETAGDDVRYYVADPGATTTHLDIPANTHFMPCLGRKPVIEQHLGARASLFGRSQVGVGIVGLINLDGYWDQLLDAVDGRRIAIYRSATGRGQYPADWEVVLIGTMWNFELKQGEVVLSIRDRLSEVVDRHASGVVYGGTNSLPDGVDGEPTDLAGKYAPRVWGAVSNVSLPMVNRSKRTYEAARAWGTQTISVAEMYTQAADITDGTDRASLAALQAATVTSATWDKHDGAVTDGAYTRLGSVSKNVTADITEGATAADRTTAQIFRRVLLGPGGLTESDLDAASFGRLDGLAPAEIGIWVGTGGATVGAVLDDVAGATWSYCIPGRAGIFRVGRIEKPSGTPVAEIGSTEILDSDDAVRIIPSAATKRGLPPKRIILGYAKNWTIQGSADITGGVAEDSERARWVAEEYRQVIADDPDRLVRHHLAEDLAVTTLLRYLADAEAEAQRRLLMLAPDTRFYECALHLSEVSTITESGVTRLIQPGDIVRLTYRRFGLSSGKLLVITGAKEDHDEQRLTLTLWG